MKDQELIIWMCTESQMSEDEAKIVLSEYEKSYLIKCRFTKEEFAEIAWKSVKKGVKAEQALIAIKNVILMISSKEKL